MPDPDPEVNGTAPNESAETVNTDGDSGGPPETIPYARFKEVNDSYRELKPVGSLMEEYNYDSDSLSQLVEFDQNYINDPVGTWLQVADSIADLPDGVREAIEAYNAGGDSSPPAASRDRRSDEDEDLDEGEEVEVPEWAQPLFVDKQAREEREAMQTHQQTLEFMVGAWDKLDEEEGISVPDDDRATYETLRYDMIALHATNQKWASLDDLLHSAREAALKYHKLSPAEKAKADEEAPVALGGGRGQGIPAPATPPKTMDEASRAVERHLKSQGG